MAFIDAMLFDLSYLLLWVVASMSAMTLRRALVDIVAMGASRPVQYAPTAPRFTLGILGTDDELSSRNLAGRRYGLFFVQGAADSKDPGTERTGRSLRMCRRIIDLKKIDFEMFIVSVGGSGPIMRQLADRADLRHLAILDDAGGSLATQCEVSTLPSCVLFTEGGRVAQFGHASPEWMPLPARADPAEQPYGIATP